MSNLPSVTADKVKTANRDMTTSTTPPATTRRPNPPDITAAKLRVDDARSSRRLVPWHRP